MADSMMYRTENDSHDLMSGLDLPYILPSEGILVLNGDNPCALRSLSESNDGSGYIFGELEYVSSDGHASISKPRGFDLKKRCFRSLTENATKGI